MTSLPLVRTEYMNVSTNTVRTGATSHGESLTDMETYVMRHGQVAASALHAWGVAEGLAVLAAPDPTSLTVKPGVALDSAGHLIVLAAGGFAITDPNVDPGQVANVPTVQVAADGVVLTATGLTGDRYLTLTWREVIDPNSPSSAPTLLHAPWLRLQPIAEVPDTGDQVVLAHVVLSDQNQITALTADHRRVAGIPAGRLELRRSRSNGGPPATVDQLPAGELQATDGGGVAMNLLLANGTSQPVLSADPAGTLALLPSGGNAGVGLHGTPPRRTLHVEGSEVHSGGSGGGFSFASRTTGSFVENPTAGERWSWYAAGGTARLWSGSDQFVFGTNAGGTRVQAGGVGAPLELSAIGGALGKLALTTTTIAARRSDGVETVVVDTVNGRIGQGTATPTHPLHVTANRGIRQNSLYLGGTANWSSLTYNAHHNDANTDWVFPDPTRTGVTLEMDDNGGTPRFQVYTTTPTAKTAWQLRLGIDGTTGKVTIPGQLSLSTGGSSSGPFSVSSNAANTNALSATNNNGVAICALNNSNAGSTVQILGGETGLSVLGASFQAASFTGDVRVTGTLSANAKQFVIDHPLDPENRYLNHVAIESSERTVVYSGNVECDDDGSATVRLPEWLEALADDFRYQLTCVGGRSDVYVSEEMKENAFGIAGGSAGQRVSWQVTGVRHDAWAESHAFFVEEDKPERERGFYRNPEAFGKDVTAGVQWVETEQVRQAHPLATRHFVRRHAEQEAARLQVQAERKLAMAR
ncbi:hypothetical protein [Amycolatopsis sp. RTGN1]|uniref:hypothetical protein n=1 Tax=Amycolatopsis ponsaeliensis TaxID=2992142 RepID=UPI002551A121|nr:hypothetical protein [Amycolatopsis sp. RTGN1]